MPTQIKPHGVLAMMVFYFKLHDNSIMVILINDLKDLKVLYKGQDKISFMQISPKLHQPNTHVVIDLPHISTKVSLASTLFVLTPSCGAAYSNVQVCQMRSNGIGSRAYIPTCLPVAHDEDGGSLLYLFPLCCFELYLKELALEAMQVVRIF